MCLQFFSQSQSLSLCLSLFLSHSIEIIQRCELPVWYVRFDNELIHILQFQQTNKKRLINCDFLLDIISLMTENLCVYGQFITFHHISCPFCEYNNFYRFSTGGKIKYRKNVCSTREKSLYTRKIFISQVMVSLTMHSM